MTETSLALGNFDGLHKGHIEVIKSAVNQSKALRITPYCVVFREHPQVFIRGYAPPKIMSDEARDRYLENLSCKCIKLDFGEIMNFSKEEFFNRILLGKLHCRAISCGGNYRFGKNAEGNVDYLKRACEENGVLLTVLPLIKINGEEISSTKIRKLIENGEIEKANELLGRNFSFSSVVTSGKKLGRKLGIPTVNQQLFAGAVKPKNGVYYSLTEVDGKKYKSVTNIGVRPTVENTDTVNCETHILDFNTDLYGKSPEVELIKYLREEIKFPDIDSLREQIKKDIQILKNESE